MTERNISDEEKRYISSAYKAKQVVGIYILNIFIIMFVISIVTLFIASRGESDASAQQFSKMMPVLTVICAGLLFIFVKGIREIKNKRAVRKGNYSVIEGMAERYTPFKIPESISYVEAGGKEVTSWGSVIKDGKIIFRSNDGTREQKEIPLKYRSCPNGKNLGEFPVLLIVFPNGEKFAVTDWNKIKNNQEYAHIKPFMLII